MHKRSRSLFLLILAGVTVTVAQQRSRKSSATLEQHEGPCDLYAAAGTPCVAAHSTTRALYASYHGPLYQVRRASDGQTLDIGLLPGPGGFADAAAQDAFCHDALCVINLVYDQSGKGNHLSQAAPGTFKGPAKGAFDTQPIADLAPITISGHKAYGIYIVPGMGLRNNNATGLAIGDEPEGIYYVIDGTHFDSGCCFDYGNSSTNGRAVGTGTMETTYFGTSTSWGRGVGPGPWIMSDMEAGLFSGQGAKQNPDDPTIRAQRFVTAVMDGGGGDRWDLRGGNAQKGALTTFYKGPRPSPGRSGGYLPMRKQGGILLGTGGDNGNGSSGTFYEGVMTSGFPAEATTDAVQANIVAATYDVAPLSLSRIKTFSPQSTQEVATTFTNTSKRAVTGLRISLLLPGRQWTVRSSEAASPTKLFAGPIAAGATVRATFQVTSTSVTGAGYLTARAEWFGAAAPATVQTSLRNVLPVKINEVRFGTSSNPTDQFIELFNPTDQAIDLSRWTLLHTPSQWATIQVASVPAGTHLAPHAFYLLGLATSGLAAPAKAGTNALSLRSVVGLLAGQTIDVEGERRTLVTIGGAATAPTTVFTPVSTGPRLTIPAGSSVLPVASTAGFEVGQKIGIDLGGQYEIATVKAVGKSSTQTELDSPAIAGATHLHLAALADLSVGDTLSIGTGALAETGKIATVGTVGADGTGVTLTAPLRFHHAAGVDVAGPGTGISFSPRTHFAHSSGDAVQALGSGVTLDRPLRRAHSWGAPLVSRQILHEGYQGAPSPNQWFGGSLANPAAQPNPAGPLANNAGSLALLDATGKLVIDAVVYGTQQSNSSGAGVITSPELSVLEGDQSQGGCIVVAPAPAGGPGISAGRFPDGADADNNCTDFHTQAAAEVAAVSAAGGSNVKVSSVDGFQTGQTVFLDGGARRETAVLAMVGTAGATQIATAVAAGATVLPVVATRGFTAGEAITIGSDEHAEAATILTLGRRGSNTVTLAAPTAHSQDAGAAVAGTGLTFRSALQQDHAAGSTIATGAPTPGAPNKY